MDEEEALCPSSIKLDEHLEQTLSDKSYSHTFTEELSHMLSESIDFYQQYNEYLQTIPKPIEKTICGEEEASAIVCMICKQQCRSRKGLKQHVAKRHTKLKRHEKCPICNKRYTHKNALKFHQKQVHEKANRVQCQVCLKDVYNKYMLSKHLETHFPLRLL
mmetsp:Transcript_31262/g.54298  ORF Transcript_31262/g.54298 Transcript_31262/m.54298 type:complete len:161 (+) Transcript_31262:69-551(+)